MHEHEHTFPSGRNALLLDLDNTLADRENAFLAWARRHAAEWAPGDEGALAYLVAHDDDGVRPRVEYLAAVKERFALRESLELLVADYRREPRSALPRFPRRSRTGCGRCVRPAGRSPS